MTDDDTFQNQFRKWIELARHGDPAALGKLLDHYRGRLHTQAEQSLGIDLQARVDGSDIIQQTCLSAYGAIDQFRGTSEPEFVQWLLKILEHNVLNVAERERKAKKRSVEREVAGSGEIRQTPGELTSPSRRAIKGEQREILKQAIEKLPTDQRDAVRLKFLEQATLAETASQLGKTEDAVSGLLQRGISRLNKILREWGMNES